MGVLGEEADVVEDGDDDGGGSAHGAWRGDGTGPSTTSATGPGRSGFVRDRTHRFPGRRHALEVLHDDAEVASVRSAAQLAGLTPTGFVAAAGSTVAGSSPAPATAADRAVLAELLQARTALRRYGVNLNQAVAVLHGAGAPVWLLQAVSGCARAAERMDAATVQLTHRLG